MSIQAENESAESASDYLSENINKGKKPSETIAKIEHVRQTNNRFWCEIISIAVKWAPKETKKVLKTIEENDRKISELMRCLQEQLPD